MEYSAEGKDKEQGKRDKEQGEGKRNKGEEAEGKEHGAWSME